MARSLLGAPVSVYALGGLNEVGKNTYVVENDKTLIIIDAGVRFPEEDLPGVDYVIPDYSHLRNNRNKIKALFITHGHEDHIGAIPFLVRTVNIPVIYAPRLAAALIRHKLKDFRVRESVKIVEYDEDDIFYVDDFKISFYQTTHSIPDAFGICIDTPHGRIVHTGDFKVDLTPVGKDINLGKMAEIGNEGVDLLLSDSTNAETPGYTQSERAVISSINDIFANAPGRLIVSTFSSNISRIQQIVEASVTYKKKIAIIGRSMTNVVSTSRELGYIKIPDASIVDIDNIGTLKPDETVILCTGSQGEPMAALSRIANGDHKSVRILPGDTVVFSSSPIPGNSQSIDKVVNQLTRLGANVLTKSILYNIHSSGHPSQQELQIVLKLFRPKYFMPIHGEYRMLKIHTEVAAKVGVPLSNSFICGNGDTLTLNNHEVTRGMSVPADDIYIDGNDINGLSNAVIHDRKILNEDGMVSVLVVLDSYKNQMMIPAKIYTRGFVQYGFTHLIPHAEKRVNDALNGLFHGQKITFGDIKNTIRNTLKGYLFNKTGRNPMIIPVIMNKGSE
ncbi:MAG TPA: ribonuclease J [Bacilli bacterium]|jgi:ribonuclease J|nr:ribonuclease J [Bacilli bacterium]MDD3389356.1 ribonuclease J [Bacilli bacterium]MDD4344876.1 ribonuclease J [Bacilli bacterium]MDD4521248.1 ribonuclease J [Bacilli bacterium]MDY0399902.1 ribonuclease J [Bacilli bacterium]